MERTGADLGDGCDLGLVYLVWLAVQTLRARTLPALEGDWRDGGGF